MIRLSRVAREMAIVDAIRRLEKRGRYKMFTKGEICKAMGITSQSKIRDILRDMADAGRLVCADTALDGYAHEVSVYGIARYEQMPLPDNHVIVINGKAMNMNGEVVQNA